MGQTWSFDANIRFRKQAHNQGLRPFLAPIATPQLFVLVSSISLSYSVVVSAPTILG